jgi:hypothetical protein
MKEKFLFVGGKADGHMIEVYEGYTVWQVPYRTEYDPTIFSADPMLMTFERETYRKIMWESGDNTKFSFFKLENLSAHEVMQMILDNYQPKRQVEDDKKIKRYEIMLERCVKTMEDLLRSPFPSGLPFTSKFYDLIYDVQKFLFREK